MLLNEFLKEHRKVQEQEATITELKKDFRATGFAEIVGHYFPVLQCQRCSHYTRAKEKLGVSSLTELLCAAVRWEDSSHVK